MEHTPNCIICKKTDQDVPLIKFTFKKQNIHICSQHIPVLIHKPHQLESLLPGMPKDDV